MVKIAVASTDGKVVNQHFGRAEVFYILETDEDSGHYEPIEIRNVNAVCRGGEHDERQLRAAAEGLSDCQIVLVSRIGLRARNELEDVGIEVYEIPGIIEESVDKLIRYHKVQELLSEVSQKSISINSITK